MWGFFSDLTVTLRGGFLKARKNFLYLLRVAWKKMVPLYSREYLLCPISYSDDLCTGQQFCVACALIFSRIHGLSSVTHYRHRAFRRGWMWVTYDGTRLTVKAVLIYLDTFTLFSARAYCTSNVNTYTYGFSRCNLHTHGTFTGELAPTLGQQREASENQLPLLNLSSYFFRNLGVF